MKKFHFSLETVKEYKNKMLENLKLEHAAIREAIVDKEKYIAVLEEQKLLIKDELNEKNAKGITPYELMNYQKYLKVLQSDIETEYGRLTALRRAEEAKQNELIEMKKETASFEKLEERKLAEYNLLERKYEERFIEEFVSNQKYARR